MKKSSLFTVLLMLTLPTFGCSKPAGDSTPTPVDAKPVIKAEDVLKNDAFTASLNTSILYLTTLKDGGIPVKGSLNIAQGSLDLSGKSSPALSLTIDLESFDSGLPLRNERVRQIFFNSDKKEFSTAVLTVDSFPADVVKKLRDEKGLTEVIVDGNLDFHGKKQKLSVKLGVSVTPAGRLAVKSVTPVEVKISDWPLADNLKSLMQVCGHQKIDNVVTVDVNVEFDVKK